MSVKQEALQSLETLPETATWDDVLYTLYVKQKVSTGLEDIKNQKTVSHEEAMKKLMSSAH